MVGRMPAREEIANEGRDPEGRPSGRHETEDERLDRNLAELLQELRVALPGVQVLFAFLLAVPFQQHFTSISAFDKKVYFATLLLTALSAALLIAPSAYHRLTFRYQQKGRLVFVANRLSIAGLCALALAMTCAIMLVTNVLFGTVATTVVTTALVLTMFVVLWAVLPLKRRLRYRDEGLPLLDPPARRLITASRGSSRASAGASWRSIAASASQTSSFSESGTSYSSATRDPFGLDRRAERRHVGQLVGGVDRQGVAVDRGDAAAVLVLARAVVLDRLVVGEGGDQFGDLSPKPARSSSTVVSESSTTSWRSAAASIVSG